MWLWNLLLQGWWIAMDAAAAEGLAAA